MLLADRPYALIGSANINDRSLLGERDSELSVLVMDGDTLDADVHGEGCDRVVRRFAHELRMALWGKIFGLADGVKPSLELKMAIEQSGSPASWQLIEQCAAHNAVIYDKLFNWTPGSYFRYGNNRPTYASILPTWSNEAASPKPEGWPKGNLLAAMPFQKEFWGKPCHNAENTPGTESIRGFVVKLPTNWTKDENNRFEYPTSLVADGSTTVNGHGQHQESISHGEG